MAETTTDDTELTREEAADLLRDIADELASGSRTIGVPVGNKDVTLSPPDTVNLETKVFERSRRLRKDVEEVSLTFTWNPTSDTAESDGEAEPNPEDEV